MKRAGFIILGVIILIILLANLSNIIANVKLYSFNHNKKVVTETKVVNAHDLLDMVMQQMKLAQKLEDTTTYSLIVKEIRRGEDELNDAYDVVMDQPQIKLKITVPVIKYKDNDMTIEFISGKGKLLKVFENGQWDDFNGTWDDLQKKFKE